MFGFTQKFDFMRGYFGTREQTEKPRKKGHLHSSFILLQIKLDLSTSMIAINNYRKSKANIFEWLIKYIALIDFYNLLEIKMELNIDEKKIELTIVISLLQYLW